ncbi:FAD-binding oxidoreductase [uncultured Winogradskyella sp.]|uniref:FAD-binding oxidoreductase n=1 Tax=uncultured Winogradskyella sp. TaxID=395353 RepID=UPI0030DB161C|tara:strand:- start:27251 stop:28237 length:987 start_codon:yes stop_codon:yes gene_type:complete
MFLIKLKNNKTFTCDKDTTIFEAAKNNNIILEHSCVSSRCRSCVVKVLSGNTINKEEELVLTEEDKKNNFVLSCNAKPLSNIELDIEDLGEITLFEKKIIPSKISVIEKLTDDVMKIVLRLPPNSNFNFNSGQYVNIIKGNITRSYSIANSSDHKNQLEFFIKNYENGLMSAYFFKEAKINDLLRLEGPIGTFFLRDSSFKNIVFLATGTGIAPIKSILEGLDKSHEQYQNKNFWVIIGARYQDNLFWEPNLKNLHVKYIPVLSRPENDWNGEKGYVQDIVLKQQIDLENTQVYACGSNDMINSAKELFFKNNLKENNFFSDAFVQTN